MSLNFGGLPAGQNCVDICTEDLQANQRLQAKFLALLAKSKARNFSSEEWWQERSRATVTSMVGTGARDVDSLADALVFRTLLEWALERYKVTSEDKISTETQARRKDDAIIIAFEDACAWHRRVMGVDRMATGSRIYLKNAILAPSHVWLTSEEQLDALNASFHNLWTAEVDFRRRTTFCLLRYVDAIRSYAEMVKGPSHQLTGWSGVVNNSTMRRVASGLDEEVADWLVNQRADWRGIRDIPGTRTDSITFEIVPGILNGSISIFGSDFEYDLYKVCLAGLGDEHQVLGVARIITAALDPLNDNCRDIPHQYRTYVLGTSVGDPPRSLTLSLQDPARRIQKGVQGVRLELGRREYAAVVLLGVIMLAAVTAVVFGVEEWRVAGIALLSAGAVQALKALATGEGGLHLRARVTWDEDLILRSLRLDRVGLLMSAYRSGTNLYSCNNCVFGALDPGVLDCDGVPLAALDCKERFNNVMIGADHSIMTIEGEGYRGHASKCARNVVLRNISVQVVGGNS